MQLYSQRDPAYDRKLIGKSKLTIHGYGCLLVSMANLYQRPPLEIMTIPGAFTTEGLAVTGTIARACGGESLPATATPPRGWCIAMTNKYASVGVPTHFFLVNAQLGLQVDPLDFPAIPEPISYPIVEYRPFSNTKFDHTALIGFGPFPDVTADRWSAADIRLCKELGILKGFDDGTFKPEDLVTREQLAAVAARIIRGVQEGSLVASASR